jgi:hypothetical protein
MGCLVRQHGAVDVAIIGCEDDGLRFSDVERGPGGEFWYVRARLRVPELDASLRVFAHSWTGFDDLIVFFRGLAADWRGWLGERTYESLEHDLRLTATHDGHGHVRLAVEMRQCSVPDGWSAAAVVSIDPGEEMTRIAEDVASLLSPSGP